MAHDPGLGESLLAGVSRPASPRARSGVGRWRRSRDIDGRLLIRGRAAAGGRAAGAAAAADASQRVLRDLSAPDAPLS
jgi:hypothetical protein